MKKVITLAAALVTVLVPLTPVAQADPCPVDPPSAPHLRGSLR